MRDTAEARRGAELKHHLQQLKAEKAEYKKYSARLRREIEALLAANELFVEYLSPRSGTLTQLERQCEERRADLQEKTARRDRLLRVVEALRDMKKHQNPDDPGAVLDPFVEPIRRSIRDSAQELGGPDPARLKAEQEDLLLQHEELSVQFARWTEAAPPPELDIFLGDVVTKSRHLETRRMEAFAANRGGDSIRARVEMRPFLDEFPDRVGALAEEESKPRIAEDEGESPVVADENEGSPIVAEENEESPIVDEKDESPIVHEKEESPVGAEENEGSPIVAVAEEEEEEEEAGIAAAEDPTIVVEAEALPLRRVSVNDEEYEYEYSDADVPKAGLCLSESVAQESGRAAPRTPAILRAMRGASLRNKSRSVIEFEVAPPVEPSRGGPHFNRRGVVPPGRHDEAVRQLQELGERLGEQNVRLRAQLEASKKREAPSQFGLDFEYDVIVETIEKTAGIPAENIELDKKLRKLEGKMQRVEMNLTGLQGRVVRKTATYRRLKAIHDELAELQDVSGVASKENLRRIVAMNATIEERRRKLATLEARIADLKHLIDVGQRQMSVKTRTPRTDVINRVEGLRVHRLIERDNTRTRAILEAEIKCLDARIQEMRDTYGEARIREMATENEALRQVCKRLKKKFYASRPVRDEDQHNLTNESQLEMMQTRIEQLHHATRGEKKKVLVTLGKIAKQMRTLAELRIEAPPVPASYEGLAQSYQAGPTGTIRIQQYPT